MKNYIKAISCLLAITSFIFIFNMPSLAEELQAIEIPTNFEIVAQKGNLALYMDKKTAEIAVEDKNNRQVWYSNPIDRAEDTKAAGVNKMNLNSQLFVKYTDSSNQQFIDNNYTGSVVKKTFKIEEIQNGVEVTFDFSREAESFKIPVSYTLTENSFVSKILTGNIEEYGMGRVVEISLLPNFGAGSSGDTGYMFVPDGSGALINFNNKKNAYAQYSSDVYGSDLILNKLFDKAVTQNIKLPVFGISKNQSGFIAVIHDGDAIANISASVSLSNDSYNKVYSSFYYRIRDYATLASADTQAKDVTLVSEKSVSVQECMVEYLFLENKKASYSDMATRYREYLLENDLIHKVADDDNQFCLVTTYYGGAKKQQSVLGFPLQVFNPLTTYQNVIDSTQQFQENGVENIVVALKGWTNGGIDQKVPSKVTFESALGGKKDFIKLQKFLSNKGVAFYPGVNLTDIYKSGNGVYSFFDGVKDILQSPATQYRYYLSTQAQNLKAGKFSLIQPQKTQKLSKSLSASADRYDIQAFLSETLGNKLYSSMNSKTLFDRQQSLIEQQKTFESLQKAISVESPNAYALKYTQFALNLPSSSSNNDIIDESIPFYQMVIHGIIPYTIEPSNTNQDDADYMLKILEYGANPYYVLTENSTEIFKNTQFNYLYTTKLTNNEDKALTQYTQLKKVLSLVAAEQIVSHNIIENGLVNITYSNGTELFINYNDKDITVGNQTIKANDYLCNKGA